MVLEVVGGGGTKVHALLQGLLADDHTQYALLAGRAGGQHLIGGPNAGDDLILSSGVSALTDEVDSNNAFGMLQPYGNYIGPVAKATSAMLSLRPAGGGDPRGVNSQGIIVQPQWAPTANGLVFSAISGNCLLSPSLAVTGVSGYGLDYLVAVAGAAGVTYNDCVAVRGRSIIQTVATTLTRQAAFVARQPAAPAGSAITNSYGMHIENQFINGSAQRWSLKIDDILTPAANDYLIAAGPANVNLGVFPGNPTNPGLNQGRCQIQTTFNENGVLNARLFQWKTFGTLVAADKVVVAV